MLQNQKMRKIFSFITLILISSVLFSQEWVYAGSGKTDGTFYLKSTYISKGPTLDNSNEVIRIWVKANYKNQTLNKKLYLNEKLLMIYEFDCKSNIFQQVKKLGYDSNGDLVKSFDSGNSEWEDPAPDSVVEQLIAKVCRMFN